MLDALVGLLAVGTIGFWVLVSAVSVALIVCVEYEKPVFATLTLVGTFLLLGWLGDFHLVAAAKANPLLAAGCLAGYFVAGTLWAFGKWWFFLKAGRADYDEAKQNFLKAHNVNGSRIPDELLEEWRHSGLSSFLSSSASARGFVREDVAYTEGRPEARRHKGRIFVWMAYWPWSFVWTMINDPIRKVFKTIIRSLQATFQKVSDHVFAGVDEDFRRSTPGPKPKKDDEEEPRDGRVLLGRRGGMGNDR